MIRLVEDTQLDRGEVLKFSGEIDFRSTPGFRSMLQIKAKARCPVLFLDMTEVTYIDSGGMAALIEYGRDAHYFGEFILVGLNERLMEIFRMVHLDEHLRMVQTREEAHAAVELTDAGI